MAGQLDAHRAVPEEAESDREPVTKLAKELPDDKIINDWEYNFLINVSGNLTVTDKQQIIVDRIRPKAEVAGYF